MHPRKHAWSRISLGAILLSSLCAPPARAEVYTASPSDDVEAIIGSLRPGDELRLQDGTYTLTERFSFDIAGSPDAPIVIRAADGASPHFHRPDARQNIWDFRAEHVVLRGIEFSGGSAGLRVQGARDLTIESCVIHGTADVALRMNDSGETYEDVRILHNHIYDTDGTGEGMYLGCNRDACRLAHGAIVGNWVHHTNKDSVEQGDGIELKEGSYGTVIRDNVIHDTNYPCILTYGTVGNGPPNVVERNLMWNCGDHAIQSAGDTTIRNNIVLSAAGSGIAMQPHQSATPSNLLVLHNTILQAHGDAITLRNPTGRVVIANNALYAMAGAAIRVRGGSTSALVVAGNVVLGDVVGVPGGTSPGDLASDFVAAHWRGEPPIDVFPAPDGALVASGAPEHVVEDDFNGSSRAGVADVGAYAFEASGNPGWALAAGFKEPTSPPPPPEDGGIQESDGGADGGSAPERDAMPPPADRDATPAPPMGGREETGGGCGCYTVAREDAAASWLLLVPLLWAGRKRSRPRRLGTRQ